MLRPSVAALALLSFTALAPAATAPTERAMVKFIQTQQHDALALLERAVNINSGTMNLEGVRRVGELFKPQFERLGFTTRWIDGAPFQRAGHLIAEHPGSGPHVMLIGHLDTVFEQDSPFQRFERVDEHTARGPGIADMKGGIVVALYALKALAKTGLLRDMHITVVLHGDEENSGEPLDLARQALREIAKTADVAIGLENAADDPATAVVARRSSSSWQLEVTGKSAHSSQIFRDDIGAGANYELARILAGFYTGLKGEKYLTVNPGFMVGSTQVEFDAEQVRGSASGKNNIIAPRAAASGDLRALTSEQIASAKQRMQAIVAASLPQTSAKLTIDDGYPPMPPTEGNLELLSMYDRVSRDLGFGPVTAVDPQRAGAADISFAAPYVDMAIDGLGLLGGGSHTPREFADLSTFQIQTQRLALLLFRQHKSAPR